MAMNFNIQFGDSKETEGGKIALASLVTLGHIGIAAGELVAAVKVAKSEMGGFGKYLAVSGLCGHAASLMKSCASKLFETEVKTVCETEEEEAEENDEEAVTEEPTEVTEESN